jgi:hypothetical protein
LANTGEKNSPYVKHLRLLFQPPALAGTGETPWYYAGLKYLTGFWKLFT